MKAQSRSVTSFTFFSNCICFFPFFHASLVPSPLRRKNSLGIHFSILKGSSNTCAKKRYWATTLTCSQNKRSWDKSYGGITYFHFVITCSVDKDSSLCANLLMCHIDLRTCWHCWCTGASWRLTFLWNVVCELKLQLNLFFWEKQLHLKGQFGKELSWWRKLKLSK